MSPAAVASPGPRSSAILQADSDRDAADDNLAAAVYTNRRPEAPYSVAHELEPVRDPVAVALSANREFPGGDAKPSQGRRAPPSGDKTRVHRKRVVLGGDLELLLADHEHQSIGIGADDSAAARAVAAETKRGLIDRAGADVGIGDRLRGTPLGPMTRGEQRVRVDVLLTRDAQHQDLLDPEAVLDHGRCRTDHKQLAAESEPRLRPQAVAVIDQRPAHRPEPQVVDRDQRLTDRLHLNARRLGIRVRVIVLDEHVHAGQLTELLTGSVDGRASHLKERYLTAEGQRVVVQIEIGHRPPSWSRS